MIIFTPKKFLNAIYLRGLNLSWFIQRGVSRETFVPRNFHRKSLLPLEYKKEIRVKTVEKIAELLIEEGIMDDKERVKACFLNDNFSAFLVQGDDL
jgi:hypothetical protein